MALGAVAVGLIFFFGFFGFQIWMFTSLIMSLAPLIPETSNVGEMIAESLFWSRVIFGVGIVMFTFVVTAITVVISHRIYGPAYAIRKHLAALARGEYDYRTHLRKGDEFKDLAQDLNSLSETLAAGQTPKIPTL